MKGDTYIKEECGGCGLTRYVVEGGVCDGCRFYRSDMDGQDLLDMLEDVRDRLAALEAENAKLREQRDALVDGFNALNQLHNALVMTSASRDRRRSLRDACLKAGEVVDAIVAEKEAE